ncbi:hypothetical protein MLD38_021900 [Melastoma candidum]|uniref:Uncharacterized protein n=1 Tax=Melastoma candidum TaxID=119954 RepID=A0ACB9QJC2_9MYRT|nr:hypothetical protein MLD38_021900 [Melastoma candidum]
MGGKTEEVFPWLKNLALAPEYHPTLSEFQDPIAYIHKIEKEASSYGICKIVPPLPPSPKKSVVSNLNKSLFSRSSSHTFTRSVSAPASPAPSRSPSGRAATSTPSRVLSPKPATSSSPSLTAVARSLPCPTSRSRTSTGRLPSASPSPSSTPMIFPALPSLLIIAVAASAGVGSVRPMWGRLLGI